MAGIEKVSKDGTPLRYADEKAREEASFRRDIRGTEVDRLTFSCLQAARILKKPQEFVRRHGAELGATDEFEGYGIRYKREIIFEQAKSSPDPTKYSTERATQSSFSNKTKLSALEESGAVKPVLFCGEKFYLDSEVSAAKRGLLVPGAHLRQARVSDSTAEPSSKAANTLSATLASVSLEKLPAQFKIDPLTIPGFIKVTGADRKLFNRLVELKVIEVAGSIDEPRLVSPNIVDVCREHFREGFERLGRELHARGIYPGQSELHEFLTRELAEIGKLGSVNDRGMRRLVGNLARLDEEFSTPLLEMTLQARLMSKAVDPVGNMPTKRAIKVIVDSPIDSVIRGALEFRKTLAAM